MERRDLGVALFEAVLLPALAIVLITSGAAEAQNSAPNCPPQGSAWNNCFGTWSDGAGYTYEGEWLDSKQHGRGVASYPSGDKYVGEFSGGQLHGQGTYTFATGERYTGDWKNGFRNGQGLSVFVDGGTYTGGYENDKRHGHGTLTLANGDKYIGEFRNDKYEGHFTVTFANGDKYVGEYKDNNWNGDGTFTSSFGYSYAGEFKDGTPEGRGTFTFASGDRYVGEFRKSKSNGLMSVTYANGDRFEGTYLDDMRTGSGIYTWSDGSRYEGTWDRGLPTSEGLHLNANGVAIEGVKYRTNAVYDASGHMTAADVLTYSFGADSQANDLNGHSSSPTGALPPCASDKTQFYDNCVGTTVASNGNKWVGEFRNNKLNGTGTFIGADGSRFDGEWKDDNPSNGTFIYANGDKYVGRFVQGQRSGSGTLTLSNGSKYVGEFSNDNFSGQGTYTFASGSEYAGAFKNNKMDGLFAVKYGNGDAFSGTYADEKRDGQGVYTWRDGSNYIGQWKDGLPTVDGVHTSPDGSQFTGVLYRSSVVYDANGFMTEPDILTFSGGVEKELKLPEPAKEKVVQAGVVRKVALVIGNSAYRHAGQLANPKNDANSMATMLSGIGFEVIKAIDADKAEMENVIREFLKEARTADVSLFFYAGHGMEVGGENLLLPVDTKLEDEAALSFEVVNSRIITNSMGGERKVGIILLDACRDNPFTASLKRSMVASRAATVSDGLAPISTDGGGLVVAFATSPGDTAADGDGENSPFTTALLKWMPEKGLEIEQVMKKVKAEVSTITKNDQRPWTNSDLTTDIFVAGD